MRAILAAGRQEGDELVSTFWCVASGCNHVRAEMLRENKRMLDKAIRELDRERMSLQQQEKKTIVEIKKMAKEGQMVRCAAWLGKPPPFPPPPHRPYQQQSSVSSPCCLCVCGYVCVCCAQQNRMLSRSWPSPSSATGMQSQSCTPSNRSCRRCRSGSRCVVCRAPAARVHACWEAVQHLLTARTSRVGVDRLAHVLWAHDRLAPLTCLLPACLPTCRP